MGDDAQRGAGVIPRQRIKDLVKTAMEAASAGGAATVTASGTFELETSAGFGVSPSLSLPDGAASVAVNFDTGRRRQGAVEWEIRIELPASDTTRAPGEGR